MKISLNENIYLQYNVKFMYLLKMHQNYRNKFIFNGLELEQTWQLLFFISKEWI